MMIPDQTEDRNTLRIVSEKVSAKHDATRKLRANAWKYQLNDSVTPPKR